MSSLVRRLFSTKTPNATHGLFYTPLKSRVGITVSGPDGRDLLQSLTTNDMHLLKDGEQPSVYTAFLQTKGRVLAESIVHKLPEREEFVLECHPGMLTTLGKHLTLYKLHRNVNIKNSKDEFDFNVFFDFGADDISKPLDSEILDRIAGESVAHSVDPRWNGLGTRFITKKADNWSSLPATTQLLSSHQVISGSTIDFDLFRTYHGIPEGSEVSGQIPLQLNLEMLNGVSFSKGCYIGQELVARSHFKGQIRRRLFPVRFLEFSVPEDDMTEKPPMEVLLDGAKIGKTISEVTVGPNGSEICIKAASLGLAMLRFEHFVTKDGRLNEFINERELHTDHSRVEILDFPQWWDPSQL